MGLLFLFYQNLLGADQKWQKRLLTNDRCPICGEAVEKEG